MSKLLKVLYKNHEFLDPGVTVYPSNYWSVLYIKNSEVICYINTWDIWLLLLQQSVQSERSKTKPAPFVASSDFTSVLSLLLLQKLQKWPKMVGPHQHHRLLRTCYLFILVQILYAFSR